MTFFHDPDNLPLEIPESNTRKVIDIFVVAS